jgi:hypothetical protein
MRALMLFEAITAHKNSGAKADRVAWVPFENWPQLVICYD